MSRRALDIAWDSLPLGLVDDEDLAAELGVPTATVRRARQRRGIRSPHATAGAARARRRALALARHDDGDGDGDPVELDFGGGDHA